MSLKNIFVILFTFLVVGEAMALPSTPPYDPRPVPTRPGGPGSGPTGPTPYPPPH